MVFIGLADIYRVDNVVTGLDSTKLEYQVGTRQDEGQQYRPDRKGPDRAMLL